MRQDVVLHRVGRERRQLPRLVRLDVLRFGRRYLAGGLVCAWMPFYLYDPSYMLVEPLTAEGGNNSNKHKKSTCIKENSKQQQRPFLSGLYDVFLHAFTVDDVFTRKVK